MLRLLFLLLSFSLISSAWASCPLQDGDIVFIKSQSSQSALLRLTTGSEWTHVGMAFKKKEGWSIIEAVQPVKWTSLLSFIKRSQNLAFDVRRANFDFDAKKVKAYAVEQLNKDYDLIFAWENERWYCSELVYKAYQKASGETLGTLQKVGDLKNIDDMRVMNEAKKRFQGYGLNFNAEEWKNSSIITPVNMMNSEKLIRVLGHKSTNNDVQDCLKVQ